MILYSHPTGNANVRHSLEALTQDNLLEEFWTCINWDAASPWTKILPPALTRQFARRTFPDVAKGRIRTAPWREVGRLLAPKLGLNGLTRHEIGPLAVDAVFQALDRRVARQLRAGWVTGVYAGEDGAVETFRQAERVGLKRFYDLPIGYWRVGQAIYAEEREREPEWADTLTGTRDSAAKLARKDEELALADVVFVASSYTRQTLDSAPDFTGRVYNVPYGSPPPAEIQPQPSERRAGKMRLLFVGSLTQRKGLSYLLNAVETLQHHVELTIIGRKPDAACAPLDLALRRHRWIESLPHGEILEVMRQHDVLLFPSLFEGFGLVILEAMSQGLPVIATLHTAGPDIITDGDDGFIVPIRSADAIAEKLCTLLEQPQRLGDMRQSAWHTAQRHTWANYRAELARIIRFEIAGKR